MPVGKEGRRRDTDRDTEGGTHKEESGILLPGLLCARLIGLSAGRVSQSPTDPYDAPLKHQDGNPLSISKNNSDLQQHISEMML